jgi:outer membrane immunogenic protein
VGGDHEYRIKDILRELFGSRRNRASGIRCRHCAANRGPLAALPFSWSGLYLGGHGGFASGSVSSWNPQGGFAGGQAGYNYQLGTWVFGVEGDGAWASMPSSASVITPSGPRSATVTTTSLATIRGRVGFAAGNWLFYGTAGGGWAQNGLSASSALVNVSGNKWQSGWAGGAGIEWAFLPNWSAKFEYIHYGLGGGTYPTSATVVKTGSYEIDTVKVGINYLFH